MSRLFYHVMQDNVGNLLFDVSGTMRLAGTGTAATIYGDEALTIPIANPMTNHPSFGSFKCFLGAGDYDFYMAKSGYTFETLTGVQGHGTMAQQDAGAVAITGGSAANLTEVQAGLVNAGSVDVRYNPYAGPGIRLLPGADSESPAMTFHNFATSVVGSITMTPSSTAYNTTSDARLKEFIETLTGALDVVRALRPITHLWRVDDSPGVGFLADEVQQVIPTGVVTGDKDAVDEAGQIVPQMIDMSRLVPFLVGAVQTLAAQVEALTARLDAAGA